jgi:hypothetical protein
MYLAGLVVGAGQCPHPYTQIGMCIFALPPENGFGLGAHASSVLINSIGVPQLYANVTGYREYEHAGSVRSQATGVPHEIHLERGEVA